jgi:uncharacterized protein DUF6455
MTDFCYNLSTFDRIFRQAKLMDRMMQRVGVHAATGTKIDKGGEWYEARTKCIACRSDRECREWLARPDVDAVSDPPEFCENGNFFRYSRITNRAPL